MNFRKILIIIIILFFSTKLSAIEIVDKVQIKGLKNISFSKIIKEVNFLTTIGHSYELKYLIMDINNLFLSGYFSKVDYSLVKKNNKVTIIFQVQENPKISKIKFKNMKRFSALELTKIINSKVGEVLNYKLIEKDKSNLEKFYHQKGYELMHIMKIELNKNQELIFDFYEGEISKIIFKGLKNIPEFILRREIVQKSGSIFNAKEIRRDRIRLLNLGYFSEVSIPKIRESKQKDKVNILFEVREKKVNLIDLGVETDEDRFYGYLKANISHIGIASSILSGKMQYTLENQMFKVKSYSLRFYEPWFLNIWPLSLAFDAWSENSRELYSDNNYYSLIRKGGDIILGYSLIKDILTISGRAKGEHVLPQTNFSYYDIFSLSLLLDYSTVKNYVNPKSGSYFNFEYEISDSWGSQNTNILKFNRYSINWANFFGLSSRDVIGLRIFLGDYKPVNIDMKTFEFEGYTIGGSSSLRGLHEKTTVFGLVKQTKKVLINLEYRHDLSPSFQGIVFCDVGQLIESWSYLSQNFKVSYGLGLRFFTPVGPFRLDFGYTQNDILIFFNLGQVF